MDPTYAAGGAFPSTCWSEVRDGAASDPARAQSALERLARQYWNPIRSYLAACGREAGEAEDLTQDFFSWMLESNFLSRAEPSRGRFRGFVKVALRNYVTDRDRERRAVKRGGQHQTHGLDGSSEGLTSSEKPPDEVLDDAWRAEITKKGLVKLEEELRRSNRALQFEVFQRYFLDPQEGVDYQKIARELGITKTDVSNYLTRAKKAYRGHLKAILLETVHSADELEEEWAWLFDKE